MSKVIVGGKFEAEDELAELLERDEAERRDVLSKPVAWEALAHNSAAELFISKEEVHALAAYDRKGSDKADLVAKQGTDSFDLLRALLMLLTKMHQLDDLKYVLTLLLDIVSGPASEAALKSAAALSHTPSLIPNATVSSNAANAKPTLPFAPLLAVLSRRGDDAYVVRCAGAVLAAFLARLPLALASPFAADALSALVTAVRSPNERVAGAALAQLRAALTPARFRELAVTQCDVLSALALHLALNANGGSSELDAPLKPRAQQRAYEALYCVWLVGFEARVRARVASAALVSQLCALLRRVRKEKVVRLAVAALRQIHAEPAAADLLLAYDAQKALAAVQAKNKQEWGDEDLAEDCATLLGALEAHVDALSSYDRYAFELAAQQLEWSPVHRSEKFWQENAVKLELQDMAALKTLRALLTAPTSTPTTLAVAASDVGEFARFHPRGKAIVGTLELKLPIMKLLNHADDAVRREALLALQKMLVTNWEYLAQK